MAAPTGTADFVRTAGLLRRVASPNTALLLLAMTKTSVQGSYFVIANPQIGWLVTGLGGEAIQCVNLISGSYGLRMRSDNESRDNF